jgi:F420-non-reducing hydrogenase iron-sulfur subunit
MNPRALKTYVFYCSNNLAANQFASLGHSPQGDTIKTISLPCSGKVDVPYLIKAFETGADGAAIVTCQKNECRHLEGNLRAQKRSEAVLSLLEEIGLGQGRMSVIMLDEGGVEQGLREIKDFLTKIKKLPKPAQTSVSGA